MPNIIKTHCPGCGSPTAIRASIRIEYHANGGETVPEEVETDALRCANAACPYAFTNLAEVTGPARFADPETNGWWIFDSDRA